MFAPRLFVKTAHMDSVRPNADRAARCEDKELGEASLREMLDRRCQLQAQELRL